VRSTQRDNQNCLGAVASTLANIPLSPTLLSTIGIQMTTDDDSQLNMMAERPARDPRKYANVSTAAAASQQPPADVTALNIGRLETETYKREWRASFRYRSHVEKANAERERELLMKKIEQDAMAALEKTMRDAGGTSSASATAGYAELRKTAHADEGDEPGDRAARRTSGKKDTFVSAVTAGRVAASLMFAKMFDARPDVLNAIRTSSPVVIIDVTTEEMIGRVSSTWKDILFEDHSRLKKISASAIYREDYDVLYLVVKEPPKTKDKTEAQSDALHALSLALPVIAISPLGATHLPSAINSACTARLEMPRLDSVTITRVIRIVTGKRCRELLDPTIAAKIGLDDLIIAVRFDRTPSECMKELCRLASAKDAQKKSRDLTLDELHGMTEAVAWAKSTIMDINAWRAGEITWDAVSSAVALTGPPGTGKTTFAKVFAAEAGNLPLICGTLAKWQGSGEAHLGHLLRAMRQDFDAARAQAPSVIFIDEVDSFPDRASLTHAYRDYVVEVVNALLEQIDGIAGREGVIVIGASNDLRRCDPALLRAGRLSQIVKISLPGPNELEKMLRVRLGGDLRDVELRDLSELAVGMTGADIEQTVKDAKRTARQQERAMTIDDLRGAFVDEDTRPAALRFRSCVHEASHIVVDVIHNGPDDVFAISTAIGSHAGASVRIKQPQRAGTYADYRKTLEIILAGRVGEEMILGEGSHGAGGEPGSDLERATTLAAAMTGSVGLAGPSPLVFLGPIRDAHGFITYDEIRKSVDAELRQAAASCRQLLERHRNAVEKVARRLSEAGRVDGAEVARILEELVAVEDCVTEGRSTAGSIATIPPSSGSESQL
jgi:cell division protease FtsH